MIDLIQYPVKGILLVMIYFNGSTPEVIRIMMEEVGDKCRVKGSGNLRTREHFLQLIDMGIDRMGVGYKSVPVVLNIA
jgi:deoxyribose-phosphate aldolase